MVLGLKYAPDTIVTIFVAALQILQIVPSVSAQLLQHGFLSDTQNMGMWVWQRGWLWWQWELLQPKCGEDDQLILCRVPWAVLMSSLKMSVANRRAAEIISVFQWPIFASKVWRWNAWRSAPRQWLNCIHGQWQIWKGKLHRSLTQYF